MTVSGMPSTKVILQNVTQPKVIEKATGKTFILVRDDVEANGKLYIAPQGMLTSMKSIKPAEFMERFAWPDVPVDTSGPVAETTTADIVSQPLTQEAVEQSTRQRRGGRPKGSKDKQPRRRPARKPAQ